MAPYKKWRFASGWVIIPGENDLESYAPELCLVAV